MVQLITFKLQDRLLTEIDKLVTEHGFSSRTDFIRAALRTKLEEYKKQKALEAFAKYQGFAKTNTSDEELEKIREKAFKELTKDLQVS